jgi:hypothetical protein
MFDGENINWEKSGICGFYHQFLGEKKEKEWNPKKSMLGARS